MANEIPRHTAVEHLTRDYGDAREQIEALKAQVQDLTARLDERARIAELERIVERVREVVRGDTWVGTGYAAQIEAVLPPKER